MSFQVKRTSISPYCICSAKGPTDSAHKVHLHMKRVILMAIERHRAVAMHLGIEPDPEHQPASSSACRASPDHCQRERLPNPKNHAARLSFLQATPSSSFPSHYSSPTPPNLTSMAVFSVHTGRGGGGIGPHMTLRSTEA